MSETNASTTVATFKILSVHNEEKSQKEGRPVFDDQEICEIRFSANKQTVGVFPAHEQYEWGVDPVTGDRTRITYAQKFNEQYKRFKAGAVQAASGTPVEELPFLTQGKRLELKALNIYTAEALAALDGNNLKMLGMGGRDLKNQAQLYLDSAAKSHDVMSVVAENEDLKRRIAALEALASSTKLPEQGSVKSESGEGEGEGASDTVSESTDADTVDNTVDPENPFSDWEADDIKLWIADADPAFEIDGRWGKAKLAEKAKEINDRIASAKAGA